MLKCDIAAFCFKNGAEGITFLLHPMSCHFFPQTYTTFNSVSNVESSSHSL